LSVLPLNIDIEKAPENLQMELLYSVIPTLLKKTSGNKIAGFLFILPTR
jgi:hypothetical protein